MEYKIEYIQKNKEEWLSEMPELIYRLVFGYNFWYSKSYTGFIRLKNDNIEQFINKHYERRRHTIGLYTFNDHWVLIVFAKKKVSVYYIIENIKRDFIKKFCLASDDAVKERKRCLIESSFKELK